MNWPDHRDYKPNSNDRQYHLARREHAWRLRREGQTYRAIGDRLHVSRTQARHMIIRHERYER